MAIRLARLRGVKQGVWLAIGRVHISLLVTLGAANGQTYTQMPGGLSKDVSPYAFGTNIGGYRNLGTVGFAGVWTLTPSELTASGAGTMQDITSYGAGSNAFFVNPGFNLSYYGLPGHVTGDYQRTSLYGISTTKFDVSKGEYAFEFDTSVGTGKAEQWSTSRQFTSGQIIHSYASNTISGVTHNDSLYQMTGSTSPCTSSSSGSGPTGATATDRTCVWTFLQDGITDGKVGLANSVVANGTPGHIWGFANDVVYGAYLYHGAFAAGQETDLQIGYPQDCAIGYVNCYTHYITGLQGGMITAEIGISRSPATVADWTANTTYKPFYMVHTKVDGVDRIYERTGVMDCVSSFTTPNGTSTFTDGACTWNLLRDDATNAWAAHYGIAFTGADAIKDALISDSTNGVDGVIFYGAHGGADLNATNQSASTTPYFAKLASGQAICFNGTTQCLSATRTTYGVVITQPSDGVGAFTVANPNGSVANQKNWVFKASGSSLFVQSYSDSGRLQSNMIMLSQVDGSITSGGPVVSGSYVKPATFTISGLPACSASLLGATAVVSNGTAYGTGKYGSAVSVTGSVTRQVLCTNTAGPTTYAWAYN